jgi:hypothetical protein
MANDAHGLGLTRSRVHHPDETKSVNDPDPLWRVSVADDALEQARTLGQQLRQHNGKGRRPTRLLERHLACTEAALDGPVLIRIGAAEELGREVLVEEDLLDPETSGMESRRAEEHAMARTGTATSSKRKSPCDRMSRAQAVKTLVHELGHALLHGNQVVRKRQIQEVEV